MLDKQNKYGAKSLCTSDCETELLKQLFDRLYHFVVICYADIVEKWLNILKHILGIDCHPTNSNVFVHIGNF